LHWAITDNLDTLLAASIGGLGTSVKAILAGIIEGRNVRITDNEFKGGSYDTIAGEYRKKLTQIEATNHGVILHKSAVFEENKPNRIIIAFDGDIRTAVGQHLSAKYALPSIWIQQYLDMIPSSYIAPLNIIKSEHNKQHKDIKAVRLSTKVSEDFILGEMNARLKNGFFKLTEVPKDTNANFHPSWDMKEYLKENATALASQLDAVKPYHNPETDKIDPSIADMKKIPFPAQAHLITGFVNAIRSDGRIKAPICGGDMGTGKTIVSLGIAHVLSQRKKGFATLIVAPGITVPKWAKTEIPETLPNATARIIKNTDDALKLLKKVRSGHRPKGLEFTIVGTDRAKLGPVPWFAGTWKRVKGTKWKAWHCPDCGKALLDPDYEDDEDNIADQEEILADWNVAAQGLAPEKAGGFFEIVDIPVAGSDKVIHKRTPNGLPKGFEVKWSTKSKLRKCQHCESKLWRPAVKNRGEINMRPRWFISKVIKKTKKYFDLMIQDEIHEVRAQDSGRGASFAEMVTAAKATLGLTGTVTNGKSSSIKEILWRTDARSLIDEGFNHQTSSITWAERYGVLERVETVSETDTGVITKQKRTKKQPKEKPGIAPELTANFLLDRSAFVELGDLGLPLVGFNEKPIFIDMDEDHAEQYEFFHNTLHEKCRQVSAATGGKSVGAWAKFNPATIMYADRPDLGATVVFNKESDNPDVIGAPAFPENYYIAKERKLVEWVQSELSENRGVVIYCNYTSHYASQRRLHKVLKDHGIHSEVLESSTSPEKRIDWFNKQEKLGTKVIICNMRLVQVGLDLLPWPSIGYYQLNEDINIVRQSSRRGFRIGQHRECRIRYFITNGTSQVTQFKRCMAKRGHAMMVEGRIDKSELAEYS